MLAILLASGCEEKFDLATLPQQPVTTQDTSYVQLSPSFAGFAGAEDIAIGNDQLLYVADTRANRVVMMNRAGQILSTRAILHPISVAQDLKLDLLVGGETVAANGDTMGAIFRLHLVSDSPDSAHRLEVVPLDTVLTEPAHPARRFPGIAVMGDDTWFAARVGPDNSSFINPDSRVLLFSRDDVFITPLPCFTTRVGTGITDINKPSGIAVAPGAVPGLRDFILTQSSEGVAYGAIWMRYEKTADFDGWVPKFDPAKPEDANVDFILPYRYAFPQAVAVDRARRDVFIADAELDSVFKYNSRGRLKGESFGFVRTGGAMLRPTGLAHFSKVLYVLDGERGEVFRFQLTTDVPR